MAYTQRFSIEPDSSKPSRANEKVRLALASLLESVLKLPFIPTNRILYILEHWICAHYSHFRTNTAAQIELKKLLEVLRQLTTLNSAIDDSESASGILLKLQQSHELIPCLHRLVSYFFRPPPPNKSIVADNICCFIGQEQNLFKGCICRGVVKISCVQKGGLTAL